MRFEFFLPFKPFYVTQAWGVPHPEYPKEFGFTRHNGIDTATTIGAQEWDFYAPIDCIAIQSGYSVSAGPFVKLLSRNEYDWDDGTKSRVMIEVFHNRAIYATEGKQYGVGQLISRCDNQGYSTGPHAHIGTYRVSWDGFRVAKLDQNEANGSFDPKPYLSKLYAQDFRSFQDKIAELAVKVANLLSLWTTSS